MSEATRPTGEEDATALLLDELEDAFHSLPFGIRPRTRAREARAAVDREFAALRARLDRAEGSEAALKQVIERRAADRLASAVCTMIDRHALNARSLAGDALLDYAEIRHGTHDPIAAVRALSTPTPPTTEPER